MLKNAKGGKNAQNINSGKCLFSFLFLKKVYALELNKLMFVISKGKPKSCILTTAWRLKPVTTHIHIHSRRETHDFLCISKWCYYSGGLPLRQVSPLFSSGSSWKTGQLFCEIGTDGLHPPLFKSLALKILTSLLPPMQNYSSWTLPSPDPPHPHTHTCWKTCLKLNFEFPISSKLTFLRHCQSSARCSPLWKWARNSALLSRQVVLMTPGEPADDTDAYEIRSFSMRQALPNLSRKRFSSTGIT